VSAPGQGEGTIAYASDAGQTAGLGPRASLETKLDKAGHEIGSSLAGKVDITHRSSLSASSFELAFICVGHRQLLNPVLIYPVSVVGSVNLAETPQNEVIRNAPRSKCWSGTLWYAVSLMMPNFGMLTPRQAPTAILAERQSPCFVIGNEVLPKEVQDVVTSIQSRITCNPSIKTLSNVPDVASGDVTFSAINFASSPQTALQFALDRFATQAPLASNDLATFQRQLDVYRATEAGIRSVAGELGLKPVKFFLQFQVSRIQTAQGSPPTAAGLQVGHLLEKVLKNAPRENQAVQDDVRALARVLA
jgi:hypothetical protein